MKKSRRGKARTLLPIRRRMGSMRLIAHPPQRCDNNDVRVPRACRSRAIPRSALPGVANGDAAFAKAGQTSMTAVSLIRFECGARREVQHPRTQRVKIATERIDIEERHRSAGDTKVMQGVRRMRTLRTSVCPVGGGRIVGNLQLAVEATASTAVALRCGVQSPAPARDKAPAPPSLSILHSQPCWVASF